MANQPVIGIALSGGGARGIAHIGIIKALLEAGIEPQIVSGTSAGAIVAGLYAAGKSVAEMTAFAEIGSNLRLVRFGNPLRGIMKLSVLKEKLREVLPEDDFGFLQHELHIATTDLTRGKLAIFSSGGLIRPIMASCALPLIFDPVMIDQHQYVDGGVYLNLPAQPIRNRCDFLIGSDVMPFVHEEVEPLQTMVSISSRIFDLSVSNNSEASRAICDFVIEPEGLTSFPVYNFSKTQELIEAGYQGAKARMPELLAAIKAFTQEKPEETNQPMDKG